MPERNHVKIQNLLQQAARQTETPTEEASSTTDASLVCASESEAEKRFGHFREKLCRIDRWNASSLISSFELFNENGRPQPKKTAAVGDFIKITLPGSGKNDWVRIIEIHETPDECVLTVRPSSDPTDSPDKANVSHFFTDDSTNNFCLQKVGKKLNFYVIGLSEKTNTEKTENVLETIRNVATANLGRYLGIQKTQWKTFCESFLELDRKN